MEKNRSKYGETVVVDSSV